MGAIDKLNIHAITKDGETRLGGTVIDLNDESRGKFTTSCLADFTEYVKALPDKSGLIISFTETEIVLSDTKFSQNWVPAAVCKPVQSVYLRELLGAANKVLDLQTIENLIRRLRAHASTQALQILDFCKRGLVEKIVKIERSRDNRGNYNFSMSRSSGSKDDFQPPQKVAFDLPVLDQCDETMEITLEPVFILKESPDGAPVMGFSLENLIVKEQVSDQIRGIIRASAKEIGLPAYFGTIDLNRSTDAWRHLENPMVIKSL